MEQKKLCAWSIHEIGHISCFLMSMRVSDGSNVKQEIF